MKRKVKLTENDIRKIVKGSVSRIINEAYDPYENQDEYEEIVERLDSAYDEYVSAMRELQKFHFNMDDSAPDMYNSYAGKYGEEAIEIARRSYNAISKLFFDSDEEY